MRVLRDGSADLSPASGDPVPLAGALLCALVAVAGVALLGGFRPALLAKPWS